MGSSSIIIEKSISYLNNSRNFGIRTDLGYMKNVLKFFDNPQDSLSIIHIAGTNGKGSTGAIIESICREAGYSTGFYSSPHLIRINERIKYNGQDISDKGLADLIKDIQCACKKLNLKLTYFENLTCAAFLYFRKKSVSIAIIEAGMGGRWDATNVIRGPLLSIITPISLEHEKYLGNSLEKIFCEKAQIIKKNSAVISAECPTSKIEKNLLAICRDNRAKSFILGRDFSAKFVTFLKSNKIQQFQYKELKNRREIFNLSLIGPHQIINAGIAVKAVNILKERYGYNLNKAHYLKGFRKVCWPGRFQTIVWRHNGKRIPIFIDAAHNPAGINSLIKTLNQLKVSKIFLILGILKDKDYLSMIKMIMPYTSKIRTISVSHERGMPSKKLADIVKNTGYKGDVKSISSWQQLFIEIKNIYNMPFIITGSLYLIGDFLKVVSNPKSQH